MDRLQSDVEDARKRLSALENELAIIEHQLFMAALQEDQRHLSESR
jgi:predicted nuclease with TOPRIM domain